MFRQCKLSRFESALYQVAFIPAEFAHVGRRLKLRNDRTKEWEDGWIVAEVWGESVEESSILEWHKSRWRSDA